MRPVGIIANPASGKDIRRLVAFGSVFGNHEKVNIVRRVLLGLDSMGVEDVRIMPDFFGIGARALDDLDLALKVSFLDLALEGTQEDSIRAARMLSDRGAACIVTLGGDGTNRAVAKTCGEVPLLPISTGTNNVFPFMLEGTLAGIAAGVVAADSGSSDGFICRAPRLEVRRSSELVDIALVDVVVSNPGFLASRAVWDVSTIREIFLTRAEPGNIGFSSVGAHICALPANSGKGVHITIGDGSERVKAPIAPGLIRWVSIGAHRVFEPTESIPISHTPSIIALDGERELVVAPGDRLTVHLSPAGPRVIDISQALRQASERRFFLQPQP
ncbi:MAG: NAD(+)/NADH kinase [Deltaproteobacteria bacterium]|nr:NAD(+)/NADH kinase [Deltaproteobacteria bacterium]